MCLSIFRWSIQLLYYTGRMHFGCKCDKSRYLCCHHKQKSEMISSLWRTSIIELHGNLKKNSKVSEIYSTIPSIHRHEEKIKGALVLMLSFLKEIYTKFYPISNKNWIHVFHAHVHMYWMFAGLQGHMSWYLLILFTS